MSNNNNNNKSGLKRKRGQAAQQKRAMNDLLNDIRAAAGVPAKGKGRGKRNRQNRGRIQGGPQLTGKGDTRNAFGNKASMPVEETEYVAEITPTAFPAFSLQQFAINPGQAGTFPWLANIARNFDKYEFDLLEFIYRREVSEFANNGQTGKVMLAFDPDASDPAPISKQQLEAMDPHVDGMPCENMVLRVPASVLRQMNASWFVRPGAQPANTDLKTYDIGVLYVACQGTAANTVVGELHVHYRLRLRVPNLVGPQLSGTLQAAGGSIAAATPFGAAPVATGGIGLACAGVSVITATGLVIGAEYYLSTQLVGTVMSVLTQTGTTGATNVTVRNSGVNAAATNLHAGMTFTATATTATITLAVTATTVTAGQAVMCALSPTPAF